MKPASKDLPQISHRDLRVATRAEINDVPVALIRKQKGSGRAFTLACDSSGLDDKEIYYAVGIDAGTFSKIKGGLATLQAVHLAQFCRTVNNRIYPEWHAFQVGCTLVQIRSESERLLAEERERRKEVEAENRILRGVIEKRMA